jgi:hypothetical protein
LKIGPKASGALSLRAFFLAVYFVKKGNKLAPVFLLPAAADAYRPRGCDLLMDLSHNLNFALTCFKNMAIIYCRAFN